MSQENVEIVRRIYTAFDQREWEQIVDLVEPDFVWVPDKRTLAHEPIRGRENVLRFFEDQIDVLDVEVQPNEFFEKGDQVVAFVRLRGRGHASGAGYDIHVAHVWTFRAGRPVRGEGYPEREHALEAVGLGE
jgi:ketosteroid isomerase-like protein